MYTIWNIYKYVYVYSSFLFIYFFHKKIVWKPWKYIYLYKYNVCVCVFVGYRCFFISDARNDENSEACSALQLCFDTFNNAQLSHSSKNFSSTISQRPLILPNLHYNYWQFAKKANINNDNNSSPLCWGWKPLLTGAARYAGQKMCAPHTGTYQWSYILYFFFFNSLWLFFFLLFR